jgi:hypothetical protein
VVLVLGESLDCDDHICGGSCFASEPAVSFRLATFSPTAALCTLTDNAAIALAVNCGNRRNE